MEQRLSVGEALTDRTRVWKESFLPSARPSISWIKVATRPIMVPYLERLVASTITT